MIQFLLTLKRIRILNLLKNLVNLNSIGGLFSRFSEAAAKITESTSSMVLEERAYGVSQDTEPTSFQDAILDPESKEDCKTRAAVHFQKDIAFQREKVYVRRTLKDIRASLDL